jgi:NTE family protein
MTKSMKKNVSLVLSSGGARGMAHIGIIEELIKNDFKIHSVAGSSIGAVVGGIYASGKLEEFADWVKNLHRIDVFKLMDFTMSSQGFLKGEKVFSELKKFIPDKNIEDLNIPFSAVATDPKSHKEAVFTSGSLYDAMRASISIPGILIPGKVKNTSYLDGGVLNPVPIDHVKRDDGDMLVVIDLNADLPYNKPKYDEDAQKKNEQQYQQLLDKFMEAIGIQKKEKTEKKTQLGYYELLNTSVALMQEKLTHLILEKHEPDLLIPISKKACKTFEFYRANELIEVGRMAFKKSYEKWSKE